MARDLNIAGLVLARGGSKGIPLKNLSLLGGETLLGRCLEMLKQCQSLHSIWVSTDHAAIAETARSHGANVHHRAAHTATDTSSSLAAVQEFIDHHPEIDVIVLVQCTSPFLPASHVELACKKIRDEGYDSMFCVTRSHALRWFDQSGELKPLNFDPASRPRRQDWPGELVENGAFYASKVPLIKRGLLQGGRCGYVELASESSHDIDSPFDLWVAEQYLKKDAS